MIKLTIQSIPPVAMMEAEAGSIGEAVAMFGESGGSAVLTEFFGKVLFAATNAQSTVRTELAAPAAIAADVAERTWPEPSEPEPEGNGEKPKRHRRTKAEIAADKAAEQAEIEAKIAAKIEADKPTPAVVANAPAPMPVPGVQVPAFVAAPAPAVDTTPNAAGIPAFLARPVAPPPPAPPVCLLGRKVADNLKVRGESQELLDWIIGTGICKTGATWDEALSVFLFTTDEKVAPIAAALGVS